MNSSHERSQEIPEMITSSAAMAPHLCAHQDALLRHQGHSGVRCGPCELAVQPSLLLKMLCSAKLAGKTKLLQKEVVGRNSKIDIKIFEGFQKGKQHICKMF